MIEYLTDKLVWAKGNLPVQDSLLDVWLDGRDMATEWDAEQWGFSPSGWMRKERLEMRKRQYMARNDDSFPNT
jgi:hypothetical protein